RVAVSAVPVPPKAVPPPLAAPPLAAKPAAPVSSMPAIPAPVKSAVELPPRPAPKPAPLISPVPVNIAAPPPAPPVIAPAAQQAVTVAPAVPPPPPSVGAKPEPVATKRVPFSLPSPDFAAAISSLFDSPAVSEAKPALTESPKIEAVPAPAEPSTEQLKLQTARLQEQLSSLLFTETPVKPPSSPVPAGIAKTESTIPEPIAVPQLPALSATIPASLSASEESLAGGVTESHRSRHSSTFG